ncbi:Septum site-determining protein minD homolog, chloroplastic [Linum perenne]
MEAGQRGLLASRSEITVGLDICSAEEGKKLGFTRRGVGKTTTTVNIGISLARLGFSVVAVDCDVSLCNLDLLLGLENRVNYTLVEVLNGDCRLDQALVRDKRWPNFELLCISKSRSKLPLGQALASPEFRN